MIPYSYNMVDMGGIDLAEANGTVVPGIYEKIVEAMNLCGDLILYNWKFAGINIAPSAYTILQQANSILINGLIQVTELDQITVIGLPPPLVPVSPLQVTENGVYEAEPPASGFNPVSVSVLPTVMPLEVTENGVYTPPIGVDGFSPVSVSVGGDDWTGLKNYIESSGTQWINTGYSVKDNSKFEVIANPSTTQPIYATIFGTRAVANDNPSSESCILATTWASNLGNVNWGSGINRLTSEDKGNKTKYVVIKNHGLATVSESINGIIGFTPIDSTRSATSQNLFLFALGQNNSDYGAVTHCNMKLYRFRIYEGDTLVHEYLPWQENGVPCLKDTVSENILYNAGTGNFVYGTDV